jgi:NADH dehydrogenase/NADH:ubiquinone oxidoreductase subunit G
MHVELRSTAGQSKLLMRTVWMPQSAGIYVPHFAITKSFQSPPYCRMCLVQVEKAPKPLPACATPVTKGMKVFTHSDKAVDAQERRDGIFC